MREILEGCAGFDFVLVVGLPDFIFSTAFRSKNPNLDGGYYIRLDSWLLICMHEPIGTKTDVFDS